MNNMKKMINTIFAASVLTLSQISFAVDYYPATAPALGRTFPQWTAEWWQHVTSIPTAANPILDPNGSRCMVGEHGPVWFLYGSWVSVAPGAIVRNCTIPAGKALFFPIYTSSWINTPSVCGDPATNRTVAQLRALALADVEGIGIVSTTVDGVELPGLGINNPEFRVASSVFDVTLPEANIFDQPCLGIGNVPKGIYTPAAADGVYTMLKPLPVGKHTIKIKVFSATNCIISCATLLDVTYNLTIVPIRRL
jgi:hypothetical protein